MLRAGVLFYAIVIALLMALTSSFFIAFAYHNRLQVRYLNRQERLIRNVSSGINLLLADQEKIALNTAATIDLFDNGNDSVFLKRASWGLYEIAVASAFSRNKRFTHVIQTGEKMDEKAYPSLYLSDMDKPLSLCGETVLKGNCYLPKAGLKRAYIEGQSYSGEKLVYGNVLNSDKTVPQPDKAMLESIIKKFSVSSWQTSGDSIVSLDEKEPGDTVKNSFLNRTICLYSNGSIDLRRTHYSGNIVIISEKKIIINEDAELKDVLLFAPYILIRKNVNANLQAFASDSLVVEEKCTLHYPTALGVFRKQGSADFPSLIVKEEANVSGILFAWEESQVQQKQVKVSIGKKTEINGQVYSSSIMDMKGDVKGSVICQRFILSTPSSVYENHLLNAKIDQAALSPYFAGVRFLKNVGEKRIVKYLE